MYSELNSDHSEEEHGTTRPIRKHHLPTKYKAYTQEEEVIVSDGMRSSKYSLFCYLLVSMNCNVILPCRNGHCALQPNWESA